MNVLVVGGSGFLGRHLIAALLERNTGVRVYGRRGVPQAENLEYVYGDLFDRRRLREALDGVDRVFHLAWSTVPQTSNEDPQADVQANVSATLGLLDACRDVGVEAVVFPSSGGTVYGMARGTELFTEETPTEPVSSYGITKLTIEKYLALYRHMHGIDYRILRISNAYGEGQQPDRPQGLIGVVLQRLATNQGITVWGDGSTVRDYVYAGDVGDAFIRAGFSQLSEGESRIFNIGSEKGYSVRDVLTVIEEVTGQRPDVTYAPARACDVAHAVLSSRRARDVLGWSSQTSLEAGIERTSKWVSSTLG